MSSGTIMVKEPPIFIIGCPRSGTTLLASFLENTRYGAPVETHFIIKYYKRLKKYLPLTEKKNFHRLVKSIINERPIQQWKINFDIDKLWNHLQNPTYSEIVNLICMERYSRLGKRSWGDKTPHYILSLNTLFELFPNSKYIYIVRDGRDVALSLLQKKWGPNNVYSCALYWKMCNTIQSDTLKKIKEKGNLFEIRYEDLLLNPTEVIRQLYDFLQEDIAQNVLISLAHKIKKDNFYKWKTRMSFQQLKIFESVAGDVLEYYGYEVNNDSLGVTFYEKVFYKIHDLVLKWIYLIELNTIDWIKIRLFEKEPFGE